MSSTWYPYFSSKAVDGNKPFSTTSQVGCSAPLTEATAWWQVDLLAIYLIKDVVLSASELELNQSVC